VKNDSRGFRVKSEDGHRAVIGLVAINLTSEQASHYPSAIIA